MGQRNMIYTGSILETEHILHLHHPEPPYAFNPQHHLPENHTILPPPLPGTTFNPPQHLPENHTPLPHTITQYNNTVDHHHHHNVLYMTPPGSRVFPVAINQGIPDQIPIPFSIRGTFERNEFMDGMNGGGGPFKRKNAEGFLGNVQYFYPGPGSSSLVTIPMNAEGGMMDGGGSFAIPEFRGGNRDPVLSHGSNGHLIPGNYGGQPGPLPWLDQQFCGGNGDSGAFSWNHAPGIPYLQGHITESANIGIHGYQVPTGNRNSGAFVHGPHSLHHPPPPPMPPMQGHNNMDFHSQLASTSSLRLPLANTTATINPFQNGMEPPGPRFVGPTPPTGLRIYRPHRRELMVEASTRHRGFPHLRVLPEDGVAILDISGYHEVGHSVDHHRDMRLDIDHMSYEELLALGEQIGSVGSRLSDDFVVQHLKTRLFTSSHPQDASSSNDQELNSCVICQTNYDDQEEIGVLDCGHEYHVECVKKWLVVKNTCPVCKSTALAGQQPKKES